MSFRLRRQSGSPGSLINLGMQVAQVPGTRVLVCEGGGLETGQHLCHDISEHSGRYVNWSAHMVYAGALAGPFCALGKNERSHIVTTLSIDQGGEERK